MDAALDHSDRPGGPGGPRFGAPRGRYEARFPAVQPSALAVRQFAAAHLGALPREMAEALAVVVSELASNAVQHAATDFVVRIDIEPRRIRIEVEDAGGGDPVMKRPGADEDRGRGLQIVSGLSTQWGVVYAPSGRGKTVWAELAPPSTS